MTHDWLGLFWPVSVLVILYFQCYSLRHWRKKKRKKFTLSWNQGACPAWCQRMHYSWQWAGDVRTRSSGRFYWRHLHMQGDVFSTVDECFAWINVLSSLILILVSDRKWRLVHWVRVSLWRTSEERGRRQVWQEEIVLCLTCHTQ